METQFRMAMEIPSMGTSIFKQGLGFRKKIYHEVSQKKKIEMGSCFNRTLIQKLGHIAQA